MPSSPAACERGSPRTFRAAPDPARWLEAGSFEERVAALEAQQ
ncbi:hypothetical protein [Nocardiopsis sp. CNT312]|nr:hypothetical protein [Nocardiopsis sp. CNT312]